MRQLKAFLNKDNLHKVSVEKFNKYGDYLVLPFRDFYVSCQKIKKYDITILGEYGYNEYNFWVLSWEALDEMFLVNCPRQKDIVNGYFLLWPMDKFKGKDLEDIVSQYDNNNQSIGRVEAMSWKDVKEIWDL